MPIRFRTLRKLGDMIYIMAAVRGLRFLGAKRPRSSSLLQKTRLEMTLESFKVLERLLASRLCRRVTTRTDFRFDGIAFNFRFVVRQQFAFESAGFRMPRCPCDRRYVAEPRLNVSRLQLHNSSISLDAGPELHLCLLKARRTNHPDAKSLSGFRLLCRTPMRYLNQKFVGVAELQQLLEVVEWIEDVIDLFVDNQTSLLWHGFQVPITVEVLTNVLTALSTERAQLPGVPQSVFDKWGFPGLIGVDRRERSLFRLLARSESMARY